MTVIAFGLIVSFLRLGVYAGRYPTAVSTWGRLVAGPWWMPRYDIIWIAPICTTAAAVAGAAIVYTSPIQPQFSAAVSVGTIIAIATLAGPTMLKWDHTGHHMFARPVRAKTRQPSIEPLVNL